MIRFGSIFLICGALYAFVSGCGYGPSKQEFDYVDVSDKQEAFMFYWFYRALITKNWDLEKAASRPMLIITGSPAVSASGYHNILSAGPFDENLEKRKHSLAEKYHLLFIDAPVATGFSYVTPPNLEKYLSKNTTEVANDIVKTIIKFFQRFPAFNDSPLYLYSESLGSRYLPDTALILLEKIKQRRCKLNFRGVILGSPFVNAVTLTKSWSSYLLTRGYLDINSALEVEKIADEIEQYVENKTNLVEASWRYQDIEVQTKELTDGISLCDMSFECKNFPIISTEVTNTENEIETPQFEILKCAKQSNIEMLMNDKVKDSLQCKVSEERIFGNYDTIVMDYLAPDMMLPVTESVETLLNMEHIKVAIINGMQDVISNTYGTLSWINNMNWNNKMRWNRAKQKTFKLGEKYYDLPKTYNQCNSIIGYQKSSRNLYYFNLIDAGLYLFKDSPGGVNTILDIVMNQKDIVEPSTTGMTPAK